MSLKGLGIFFDTVRFKNSGATYVVNIGRADDGTYIYELVADQGKRYKRFICDGLPSDKDQSNFYWLVQLLEQLPPRK